MEQNDCHGQCLLRIASGQHIRMRPCAFECLPRKCANHVVCGQWETKTILDEHGGACLSCVRRFGKKLDIVKNEDQDVGCAVCYEPMDVAPCLPQCTHRFCIGCFRVLNKVPVATEASNGHDVLEAVPVQCLSWKDANTDQAASVACPMCRAKHWLWRREPVPRPMVVMGVPRFNPSPVDETAADESTLAKFTPRARPDTLTGLFSVDEIDRAFEREGSATPGYTINRSMNDAWNPTHIMSFKGLDGEITWEKVRDDRAAEELEETNGVEPRYTVRLEQLNAKLYADAKARYERVSAPDGWAKFRLEHEREWTRDANVAGPPHILDWRIVKHEPGIVRPIGSNMHILIDLRKDGYKDRLVIEQHVKELEATEDDLMMDAEHTSAHPRSVYVPHVPAPLHPEDEKRARQQMDARRAYADSLLASIRARATTQTPDVRDTLNATAAQLEGIARHLDAEKEQLAADRAALASEKTTARR